ncbi:MAG: FAD-dependent monooxygenase [Rhodospirillales bacterium]|nr:FAD-dependent monooxygenase [Rhodospirillales bacterium]
MTSPSSKVVGDTRSGVTEIEAAVLVVGGGMVGLTLACALADVGVTSVVVESMDPNTVVGAGFDGRASAIAHAPYRMLQSIGVWPHLAPYAEAIREIRVSDGRLSAGGPEARCSPLFLHFDHRELDDAPFGYMVENRHILGGLWAAAEARPEITLCAPATVVSLDRGLTLVTATLSYGSETNASKTLLVKAQLIVGADGRRSVVRESAGIRHISGDYRQTAIVATVEHAGDHGGVAEEFFLPAGPFAILPLMDLPDGTHRSSLVWTETTSAAATILGLDNDQFEAQLRARFGSHLGEVSGTGPRWSYPLGHQHALRYIDHRLALAGDSVHGIHPIAGQGLNLGLRDVAALAEVLADGHRLGSDLGSAVLLARYQRWRRFDSFALFAVTDGLNRLFSNDIAPLRLARDLGLAVVNRTPALKRFFMRHARGTVGTLPRLLKGEPL